HELTHVVQFDRSTGPVESTGGLEAEASAIGARVTGGLPAGPVTSRALPSSGPLCEGKNKKEDDEEEPDLFSDWKTSSDSLLLIYGDDKLYILSGAHTVYFADA